MQQPLRWGIFVMALVLLAIMAVQQHTLQDYEHVVEQSYQWLVQHPWLGALIYCPIYTISAALLMPGTPLELLAGFVFGFWGSFLILFFLKPITYVAIFVIAQQLGLRDMGIAVSEHSRTLKAVGAALSVPAQSWRILLLVLVSCLPMGAKTYGLAMVGSGVQLQTFSACAIVASVPWNLANSFLGSSAKDLIGLLQHEEQGDSPAVRNIRLAMMFGGASSLILCIAALAWYTKRSLDELREAPRSPSEKYGACGMASSGKEAPSQLAKV